MAKEYIEREIPLKQIRAEAVNLLEQEGRRTNEVLAYGHCFGMVDSAPAADVITIEDAAKAFAIQTVYSTEDCENMIRTALCKGWI